MNHAIKHDASQALHAIGSGKCASPLTRLMTKIPKPKRANPLEHVCQFLIVLPNTDPLVWRRIQVPESYSFWDLHVAIQDAMGWKDYHLHEFIVIDSKTGRTTRIGIPDDEMPDERPCLAGWKITIARFFTYVRE